MKQQSERAYTVRCEVSRVDQAGCLESMFVQVLTDLARVGQELSIGGEAWQVTHVDTGNEANLFEAAAA